MRNKPKKGKPSFGSFMTKKPVREPRRRSWRRWKRHLRRKKRHFQSLSFKITSLFLGSLWFASIRSGRIDRLLKAKDNTAEKWSICFGKAGRARKKVFFRKTLILS